VATRALVSDRVFGELCEGILAGRYQPGEKLPTQRTLAAELGVNMASVREAVKRLEQLGMIEVRHGDAMRVTDWRASGGLDVLAYAAIGDPAISGAVFEARRLLLREAARLAAERRSDEQAQVLQELARAFAEAADDGAAQAIDLAFMATVIDAARNLVFTLIINSIRELYAQHLEAFRAIVRDRAALAPLYAAAAEAIGGRDPDATAAAVERLAAHQQRAMRP
jgi:GntR family transcriptional regulator, transcriptional repressor for pyruvate dehydrogenase complex